MGKVRFDPADWIVLPRSPAHPGPRRALARSDLGPCPCGAWVFAIVLVRRAVSHTDYREWLSVECPRCRMESARRADRRRVVGRIHMLRGEILDLDSDWRIE